MRVTTIAKTQFLPPRLPETLAARWETDADGGSALAEFAGRACYQSWNKPNPATATNAGYLRHILEVGHLSVLEHGSVTFYIEGVSRSLTHELVRHRHLSFSQLSQRYVSERGAEFIQPEAVRKDPHVESVFDQAVQDAQYAYGELLVSLDQIYASEPDRTKRRKLAREAARSVLPNATETKIVVTGNYRSWRHFVRIRATEHADPEIRKLAVMILRALKHEAPAVFNDFVISRPLELGDEIAVSRLSTNGDD